MSATRRNYIWIIVSAFVLSIPCIESVAPAIFKLSDALRSMFIFAILGLGINVITGLTGILHLGVAAFMAIGAYAFAILTCDIYPFQLGFWGGIVAAVLLGALTGLLLGLPAIRLKGDYLAIVTLGFGEIVQDVLRNLDIITKGTQGINPLPYPTLFGYQLSAQSENLWYYLLFGFLILAVLFVSRVERSRIGRTLAAVREDELAARCMGVPIVRIKLLSFAITAGLCSLAGALWATFLSSTGEPGNYDFQISILSLCIVIVGGLGTISGALVGTVVMIGINSVLLSKISELLVNSGIASTSNVFSSPSNWKYLIFGLALVLMMRLKPTGLTGKGLLGAAQ